MKSSVNPRGDEGSALPPAPSLAESAYVAIRDQIVTLVIPPGAPLNEQLLAAQLGVGRTPVREAIKRLESEQLINIFPRRGTFASDINIADLALITDVREQLEGHAAQRAAERAVPNERASLEALVKEIVKRQPGGRQLMKLDARVHRSVYACTHNPYLQRNLTEYYNLLLRIWHLYLDRLPTLDRHVSEHEQLLRAIIEGRGAEARKVATEHVLNFERTVRSVL
jgi:DNA-binding GntR family transcriptional regulator